MSTLAKNIEETGARHRENRRFTQGTVLSVDKVSHTARVDVGEVLPDGASVYLENVPFSPQTPPGVGDSVTLSYSNTSVHSVYISGGRLGGPNNQDSLTVAGGVSSIKKEGESSGVKGDVALKPGSNLTITRTGQTFQFDAAAGGSPASAAPPVIAPASVTGADTAHFARGDHTHEGLHSIAKSGAAQITGDSTLSQGANITLTQSGNDISIAAAGGISGIGLEKNGAAVSGSEAVLNFMEGSNVTLGVVHNGANNRFDVTIHSSAAATAADDIADQFQSGVSQDFAVQGHTEYKIITAGATQQLTFGSGVLAIWALNTTDGNVTVSLPVGDAFHSGVSTTVAPGAAALFVCTTKNPSGFEVFRLL
jgi:hypothetical protein